MIRTVTVVLFLIISSVNAQDLFEQEKIYLARDKVMPALVHIQPVITDYRTGEIEKQAVVGSGIVFHQDGYVVTNYHVAGKAQRIYCTLNDKEIVPATYIGGDPMTDISVIKLDLSEYNGQISVANFGNSDDVEVGQYVIAMGSPLSLSRSLSLGVISTKDRYFSSDVRLPSGERTGRYNLWIQTDAAINPGNSGGPLVDLNGLVIGINSRATLFANNIGFAIPINIVKEVTEEILQRGEVERSWIGVHGQALQEMENYFGTGINKGVLVASVDPDSPAEENFLRAGDVILKVNDEPVSARFYEELPKFYNTIAKEKPGSELKLSVLRGDEEFQLSVKTKPLGALQGDIYECKTWGITVKEITQQMQIDNQLKDTVGVMVEGVKSSSAADDGNLRRRDVIVKINSNEINNYGEFIAVYEEMDDSDAEKVLLTVHRNGATKFVLLDLSIRKDE